jgi:hypothetical protein
MTFEAPTEQYLSRYDFYVPATYTRNLLAIVHRRGASVLLDGAPVTGSLEPVGDWSTFTASVAPGPHRLQSADGSPLSVKVYGVARFTSYLMPGGAGLRALPR